LNSGNESKVFEISMALRSVRFHVGFCRSYKIFEKTIHLRHPFTRAVYHSDMGPVTCCADWPHQHQLPVVGFALREAEFQPWMAFTFKDVAALEVLCSEFSTGLNPRGFRRKM
jgi:hypothetical protein